jgi:hypothetical protein
VALSEREREVVDAIAQRQDELLQENPPRIEWWPNPGDGARDPARGADRRRDDGNVRRHRPSGDGSPGSTPGTTAPRSSVSAARSIAYGPLGFYPDGRSVAHTIDELVPVDGLVACAQGLAVCAMGFCGAM